MSGDLVSRKNRKTKNFQIAGPHIAIAAAPTPGMAMREELRLLKPALLYGDHVTLVSPKAAMIAGVLDIAKLNTEDFLRLIAEFAPIVSPGKHGGLDEGVKRYRELKRKRGRTPAELIQQLRFEQETRQMFESTMLPPPARDSIGNGCSRPGAGNRGRTADGYAFVYYTKTNQLRTPVCTFSR